MLKHFRLIFYFVFCLIFINIFSSKVFASDNNIREEEISYLTEPLIENVVKEEILNQETSKENLVQEGIINQDVTEQDLIQEEILNHETSKENLVQEEIINQDAKDDSLVEEETKLENDIVYEIKNTPKISNDILKKEIDEKNSNTEISKEEKHLNQTSSIESNLYKDQSKKNINEFKQNNRNKSNFLVVNPSKEDYSIKSSGIMMDLHLTFESTPPERYFYNDGKYLGTLARQYISFIDGLYHALYRGLVVPIK